MGGVIADVTPRGPKRRVTSTDVARASGVSRTTVSYVLNNAPNSGISEATRELVIRTARDLGHVPYAPARSLRSGKSNIVLAIVRDFAVGFISNRMLQRLDIALAERGYVVLVHRIDESIRPLHELWGLVSPAIVVAMGGVTLPDATAIDGSNAQLMRVHGLVPHVKAGQMQADYLFSRGHRILGYAFPSHPALEVVASERLAGVRDACTRLGLPAPIVCNIDPDDPGSVFGALDTWAAHDGVVSAVCAHNDELAILLTSAMVARGERAGTGLAIIGVDNIPSARISLTTIEIDVEAWGAAVVDSVIALLDGKNPPPIETDFLRLIVRDSA